MIKKWVLKAIVQKTISFLPFRHRINYLFQKYVTKGVQLSDDYFEDKLIHFQQHANFYTKDRSSLENITALEIGTGWYPTIPICFYLSGANEIITIDISKLTDKEKLHTTLKKVIEFSASGKLEQYLPTINPNRWEILNELVDNIDSYDFDALLNQLHIKYFVADARQLPLDDNSIDISLSNNTFEHIYPKVLEEILIEFKRVTKSRGMMSHFIDMSDHFAHLDKSITIYNFLQFSENQWDWIDNAIQPQNRLRIGDFRRIYANLDIPISSEFNRAGDLEALKGIQIHPDFKSITLEELAISHSYVVTDFSKKPKVATVSS